LYIVGTHADASNASMVSSALRNTRPRPVWTLVAVMKILMGDLRKRPKSMLSAKMLRKGLNAATPRS